METTTTTRPSRPVGAFLREWRLRRHLSQLALALEADVSARHVSYLETGRARPSREMLDRLAARLEIPLRERNRLLLAAGYAPAYPERALEEPALRSAQAVVERVLAGHEPYPALAVDRAWNLVAANRAVGVLLGGVGPGMLRTPVNVLRLSLHPEGLAPRIANLAQWRAALMERLRREVEQTADAALEQLLAELRGYPNLGPEAPPGAGAEAAVAIPLRLRSDGGLLSFLSTTMVFGTALDLTVSELAIEAFFPADAETAEALRRLAAGAGAVGRGGR